ncbi:hypothetical protein Daus18300_011009 [Diaporthe australafricana]|uniref:Uncharacterized protein n=1 Tax=Diaporthe australafricana TaxID=127596 RepID=A0ABR3W891_9PEZI
MPVIPKMLDHPPRSGRYAKTLSGEDFLKENCPELRRQPHSFLEGGLNVDSLSEDRVSPSRNGLVWTAYHACTRHHQLVIGPEDVWFAILTQISFYIHRHSEELRPFFVAHGGKKKFGVKSDVMGFDDMARAMGDVIGENVVHPELRDWILPSFSTTSYGHCGLPSASFKSPPEGDGWREILRRLDTLELLGSEPSTFASMLRPILSNIIFSLDDPIGDDAERFWKESMHPDCYSGTDCFTGWLTAFCYWDEQGKVSEFWDKAGDTTRPEDISYPTIAVEKIPSGLISVPVEVRDKGEIYRATFLAGSFGIHVEASPPPLVTMIRHTDTAENPTKENVLTDHANGQKNRARFGHLGAIFSKFLKVPPSNPEASESRGPSTHDITDRSTGPEGQANTSAAPLTLDPLTGWWMYKHI